MRNKNKKAHSEFFDNGHRISSYALEKIVYTRIRVYNANNDPIPAEEIDGVASRIYAKVYASEDKFDPTRACLNTWVSKIADNCIKDFWEDFFRQLDIDENTKYLDEAFADNDAKSRDANNFGPDDDYYSCSSSTNRKIKSVDDIIDESDFEEDLIKEEEANREKEWLHDHVKLLTDNRRFVVEEILKGTDREEIARKLGKTTDAVNKLKFDAIKALTKMLNAEKAAA